MVVRKVGRSRRRTGRGGQSGYYYTMPPWSDRMSNQSTNRLQHLRRSCCHLPLRFGLYKSPLQPRLYRCVALSQAHSMFRRASAIRRYRYPILACNTPSWSSRCRDRMPTRWGNCWRATVPIPGPNPNLHRMPYSLPKCNHPQSRA